MPASAQFKNASLPSAVAKRTPTENSPAVQRLASAPLPTRSVPFCRPPVNKWAQRIMRSSHRTSLGAFVVAGLILAAGTGPADAATCKYTAVDAFGSPSGPIIIGRAAAAKKKTACKWAKNHCLRKLNKHRKKNPHRALVCVRS